MPILLAKASYDSAATWNQSAAVVKYRLSLPFVKRVSYRKNRIKVYLSNVSSSAGEVLLEALYGLPR